MDHLVNSDKPSATEAEERMDDRLAALLRKQTGGSTLAKDDPVNLKQDKPDVRPSLVSLKPGRLHNGLATPKNNRVRTNACPISMVSGEELLTQVDFELPGPMPLVWERTYRSSHDRDVGLGVGWASPWLARLHVQKDCVTLHNGEGREIEFIRPKTDDACYHPIEELTLYCDGHSYRVVNQKGETARFVGAKDRKRLEYVSNRYGYSLRLHYNDSNRLSAMTDSAGRYIRFAYNINGHLRLVHLLNADKEPQGQPLVQYRYNNSSDLVAVIDAAGNEQKFNYNNHVLTQRTTKDGFNFYLEWDQYDIYGKCIQNWGDRSVYAYQFEYDMEKSITCSTDGRGYTTEYYYNHLGLITKEICPLGGVSEWEYDEVGRLLLERDPMGNCTHYEYNEHGLVRVINPLQETTEYQYDSLGNVINLITPDGAQWHREYDAQRNVIAESDPLGNITHYRYDSSGHLVSVTDPGGNETHFEWNDRGELISQTDVLGEQTQYFYDELGRVTRVVQDRDRVTQYKYDALGYIKFVIQPDGSNSQLLYTPEGRLTHYIDPLGRTTQYRYDGLNQPVERIDPSGQRFKYLYDPERNLIALLNQNNDRYELRYDENQRLIMEIGFDGRIQEYKYNIAGHLLNHTDGAYRYTEFMRDALGRMVKSESSGGSWSEFIYDAMGRMTKACNNNSELIFAYDANGRLTDELQNGRRIQYRYDNCGNRTHTVLPNGQVLRVDYNAAGLFTCINYMGRITSHKAKGIAKVLRNSQGRETKRQVGENINSLYSYDPMGRLVKQRLGGGQVPIMERQYRYNKAGNLSRVDDLQRGITQFRYDALDRIKLVMGFATEQFQFDPAGNILDSTQSKDSPQVNVKGYQVRTLGESYFDYDDSGNLIQQHEAGVNTRYAYNDQNLLVKAFVHGQVFEYCYDALGRRCKKKDASGETEYLWDGDVLLSEQRKKINITYVHEPGGFIPLCQITDNKIYYYHNDHIGTPLLLTDSEGEVVWEARYKVFGSVSKYQEEFIENPIRFQGQYLDKETGLHYNRNRYYHPELGRFINQDPIGLLGGENHYQYAPNPLRWVDPLGLRCKEAVKDIGFLSQPLLKSRRPRVSNYGENRRIQRSSRTDKVGWNNMARVWLWSLENILSDSYVKLYGALKNWRT